MAHILKYMVSGLSVFSSRGQQVLEGEALSQCHDCFLGERVMAWRKLEFRTVGFSAWCVSGYRNGNSWREAEAMAGYAG